MEQNNGGFNQFAMGFIIGGVLGVLYAPKSGKESRETVQELLKIWMEKAEDLGIEFKQKVAEPVLDEIQPIAQEKYAQAVQLIHPVAQGEPRLGRVAQNVAQETEEKIAEAIDPAIEQARQEIRTNIQKRRPQFFRGV